MWNRLTRLIANSQQPGPSPNHLCPPFKPDKGMFAIHYSTGEIVPGRKLQQRRLVSKGNCSGDSFQRGQKSKPRHASALNAMPFCANCRKEDVLISWRSLYLEPTFERISNCSPARLIIYLLFQLRWTVATTYIFLKVLNFNQVSIEITWRSQIRLFVQTESLMQNALKTSTSFNHYSL